MSGCGGRRRCCANGDHDCASQLTGNRDDAFGESGPVQVGLHAGKEHEVAGGVGIAHDEEVILRPPQLALAVFINEGFWSLLGEIEKRVGVDAGHDGQGALLNRPLECTGGNAGDVEPAAQRDHQHGVTEGADRRPICFEDVVDAHGLRSTLMGSFARLGATVQAWQP